MLTIACNHSCKMVEKVGSSVSMPRIAACKAAASDSVPSVMLTLDEKLDLQCIYYQSNVLINMVISDISATVYKSFIFTIV